jgi:hypothetical protein
MQGMRRDHHLSQTGSDLFALSGKGAVGAE